MSDRKAMLAKVHIARKDLCLTEDDYRATLERLTKKTSARDLTEHQLDAVLKEFARLGWTPKAKLPKQAARDPMSSKVRGMWIELGKAGVLDDRSEAALRSWVTRMTGVTDLRFCEAADKVRLIEALKAWSEREGVEVLR